MNVLGVDPGNAGALALLRPQCAPLLLDMPTRPRGRGHVEIHPGALADLLRGLPVTPDLVCLEDVCGGGTGWGSAASFRFGQGFGEVLAAIELALPGVPLLRVAPRTWKAQFSLLKQDKQASIDLALALFPDAPLVPPGCRKPSHDRAEAVLLAAYGLLHLQGDL